MKKNILILSALFLLFATTTSAQFAVGYSVAGNVLTFKLKPSSTKTTGFSVIEFFLRYPSATPSFTYGAVTVNSTNFPVMTSVGTLSSGSWEIERDNPAYAFPGFKVDHFIYTAPAPTTTPVMYNANQIYDLISVPLTGNANVNFQLIHQNTEAIYYLALTDENGGDLRPAAFTDYFFPTTLQEPVGDGGVFYYAGITVPLPVKFLNFSATKNNNSALLNWSVENENSNTEKYDILSSSNGVDFTKVASIAAKNNGKSTNNYTYTQENLSDIRNNGFIYYRISQIDKDGKSIVTDIRNVRMNAKGLVFGVYPNPIKAVANVSFDLEKDSDVILSVLDAGGKQILTKQVQGFKGANIRAINMDKVATGSYMLKIQTDTEIKTMPIIKGTN